MTAGSGMGILEGVCYMNIKPQQQISCIAGRGMPYVI